MICVFPPSAVGRSMVCDCGISSVSWPCSHLLFRVVSDVIPRYGILLTEHFQRLGCVMNNKNEIGCDAYAAKSLS